MKNLIIDSTILANFKTGVKATVEAYRNHDSNVYYMEACNHCDQIEASLDRLIDAFCEAIINNCMSAYKDDISLRLQIIDIASKYELPINYVEDYILEGSKVSAPSGE